MLGLTLLLAVTWIGLTGSADPVNALFGLVLGRLALWPLRGRPLGLGFRPARLPQFARLLLLFVGQLFVANAKVLWAVLFRPRARLRPGIVAVPLDLRSDAAITLFANAVTLTPGTLSLDVSTDRRTLYVHAFHVDSPEALRRELKDGLERAVREALE